MKKHKENYLIHQNILELIDSIHLSKEVLAITKYLPKGGYRNTFERNYSHWNDC